MASSSSARKTKRLKKRGGKSVPSKAFSVDAGFLSHTGGRGIFETTDSSDVHNWSIRQVCDWITGLTDTGHLQKYCRAVKAHKINGHKLVTQLCSGPKLKTILGIRDTSDRHLILSKIAHLSRQHAAKRRRDSSRLGAHLSFTASASPSQRRSVATDDSNLLPKSGSHAYVYAPRKQRQHADGSTAIDTHPILSVEGLLNDLHVPVKVEKRLRRILKRIAKRRRGKKMKKRSLLSCELLAQKGVFLCVCIAVASAKPTAARMGTANAKGSMSVASTGGWSEFSSEVSSGTSSLLSETTATTVHSEKLTKAAIDDASTHRWHQEADEEEEVHSEEKRDTFRKEDMVLTAAMMTSLTPRTPVRGRHSRRTVLQSLRNGTAKREFEYIFFTRPLSEWNEADVFDWFDVAESGRFKAMTLSLSLAMSPSQSPSAPSSSRLCSDALSAAHSLDSGSRIVRDLSGTRDSVDWGKGGIDWSKEEDGGGIDMPVFRLSTGSALLRVTRANLRDVFEMSSADERNAFMVELALLRKQATAASLDSEGTKSRAETPLFESPTPKRASTPKPLPSTVPKRRKQTKRRTMHVSCELSTAGSRTRRHGDDYYAEALRKLPRKLGPRDLGTHYSYKAIDFDLQKSLNEDEFMAERCHPISKDAAFRKRQSANPIKAQLTVEQIGIVPDYFNSEAQPQWMKEALADLQSMADTTSTERLSHLRRLSPASKKLGPSEIGQMVDYKMPEWTKEALRDDGVDVLAERTWYDAHKVKGESMATWSRMIQKLSPNALNEFTKLPLPSGFRSKLKWLKHLRTLALAELDALRFQGFHVDDDGFVAEKKKQQCLEKKPSTVELMDDVCLVGDALEFDSSDEVSDGSVVIHDSDSDFDFDGDAKRHSDTESLASETDKATEIKSSSLKSSSVASLPAAGRRSFHERKRTFTRTEMEILAASIAEMDLRVSHR